MTDFCIMLNKDYLLAIAMAKSLKFYISDKAFSHQVPQYLQQSPYFI